MSDQDPRTRLRNVPPNRWLTYAMLVAFALLFLFGWLMWRVQSAPSADPTPTPVATMTPTPMRVIVTPAPPTIAPPPTATTVPSAVVVPVIVLPPLPAETPAPTETPAVRPSMVQRGEVPPTGRST
jgi:hypothetical protein